MAHKTLFRFIPFFLGHTVYQTKLFNQSWPYKNDSPVDTYSELIMKCSNVCMLNSSCGMHNLLESHSFKGET